MDQTTHQARDQERKILTSRFGLNGGHPKTLEDVGVELGITRERIRQLQNVALEKLRRAIAKNDRDGIVELEVAA